MTTTRTLIKSGDGNATAALTVGTVTNVAVVTLPSDPGYEYDVYISVLYKIAGSAGMSTTLGFGGRSITTKSKNSTVAGTVISLGYHGDASLATTAAGTDLLGNHVDTGGAASTIRNLEASVVVAKYGPGVAVTCSLLSGTDASTYYLHYSYIGRKTVTESF